MCTNGVNVTQFQMMLEQMDDQIALNRRWVHKLYHEAANCGFEKAAVAVQEVQRLLDEARAQLTDASDYAEKDAERARAVTVELV